MKAKGGRPSKWNNRTAAIRVPEFMVPLLLELAKRGDEEGYETSEKREVMYRKDGVLYKTRQVLQNTDSYFVQNPYEKETVKEVFAYWQRVMQSPQSRLTPEREKKIRARIEQGFTVDQIKQGVDGCRASAFHMGDNQSNTKHNDIELICRNGSKLEGFIAKANGANGSAGQNGATPVAGKYANRR